MQFRTALISGASSGIGAAVARLLAAEGWRVILVGRDRERLDAVAADCNVLGAGGVRTAAFDVRDGEAFSILVAQEPVIDLFVSNAGILDGRRHHDMLETPQTAREVLEVNLLAAIDCLHRILPTMCSRRRGHIALVSSLAAYSPLADAPAYSASKAGLLSYGLAMREALRDSGVSVTVICPGYVSTPMGDVHLGNRPYEVTPEVAARKIVDATLRGRASSGFPALLYQTSRLSLLLPAWLTRRFTAKLRFQVGR